MTKDEMPQYRENFPTPGYFKSNAWAEWIEIADDFLLDDFDEITVRGAADNRTLRLTPRTTNPEELS